MTLDQENGNGRVRTHRHAHGQPEAKQRQELNLYNLHNTIARQGLKVVFFVQEKDSKKVLNAVVADVK